MQFHGVSARALSVEVAQAADRGVTTARELLDSLFDEKNKDLDPRDKRLIAELVMGSLPLCKPLGKPGKHSRYCECQLGILLCLSAVGGLAALLQPSQTGELVFASAKVIYFGSSEGYLS